MLVRILTGEYLFDERGLHILDDNGSAQGQATATNGLSVSASTNSAGEHTHSYYWGSMAASAGTGGMYGAGWNNSKATSSAGAHSHTVTTSITGDTETRPKNLACNKLIKI